VVDGRSSAEVESSVLPTGQSADTAAAAAAASEPDELLQDVSDLLCLLRLMMMIDLAVIDVALSAACAYRNIFVCVVVIYLCVPTTTTTTIVLQSFVRHYPG